MKQHTIPVSTKEFNEAWMETIQKYGGIELRVLNQEDFVQAVLDEAISNPLPGAPSPLAQLLASCMVRVIERGDPSIRRPTFGNTFTEGWDF